MKHNISLAWITKTGELIRVEVDGIIYNQDKINLASEIITDGVKSTDRFGIFSLYQTIGFCYKGNLKLFQFNDDLNYKSLNKKHSELMDIIRNRVDAVKTWKLSIERIERRM